MQQATGNRQQATGNRQWTESERAPGFRPYGELLHFSIIASCLSPVACRLFYSGSVSPLPAELAGEPILARLTRAPANDAPIGGLKVITENAWFAARPSGTEDVYKIYAESFHGPAHLQRVVDEAREIVAAALRP